MLVILVILVIMIRTNNYSDELLVPMRIITTDNTTHNDHVNDKQDSSSIAVYLFLLM